MLLLTIWLGLSTLATLIVLSSCMMAGMADQEFHRDFHDDARETPLDRRAREIGSQRLAAANSYLALPILAEKPYASRRRRRLAR